MRTPIDIRIDTNDLFSDLQVSQEEIDTYVDRVMKDLTYSFLGQVEKEAQGALHSTRQRYIRNLLFVDSGRLEGTAMLDYSKDKMIRMIEEGASSFDMKEHLLKSSKVKFTKAGDPYISVPFRLAAPDSVGESDVFQSKLPKEVHAAVKGLDANIPVQGGGMRSRGLKLNEIPEQFQVKGVNKAGDYTHKNSLYEGVIKQTDPVTKQNRYGSFRRVSLNSDPRSWIHPGLEKRGLFERGMANFQMEEEVIRSLDVVFEQMGFEAR